MSGPTTWSSVFARASARIPHEFALLGHNAARAGEISVLNSFVVLAILLFGGDAAILFAAATAMCLSLSKGKDRLIIAFEASVSALSAFVVVWTIRLNFGMVTEPGYTPLFF